jgi:hypothetical protein
VRIYPNTAWKTAHEWGEGQTRPQLLQRILLWPRTETIQKWHRA